MLEHAIPRIEDDKLVYSGGDVSADMVGATPNTHAGEANPHNINKSKVGLSNVDNTSDADKPVSTAQASAINAKYTKPGSGIPKADLVSGVQTSLDAADSAVQPDGDELVASDAGNTLTTNIKFWKGSQAAYDAIGSPDSDVIYIIV